MIGPLIARIKQGHRTLNYPQETPPFSPHYRGLPVVDASKCAAGCDACRACCPVDAIERTDGLVRIDLGTCLFCGECATACPPQAIVFSQEHRMAARMRDALVVAPGTEYERAAELEPALKRLFGRSFRLRQVSAGGCNACEADTNVLNTLAFDLSRFGVQFVAAPRHADGLLVTGPVSRNMELALKKTYDAVPSPKVVIAVGACAISGGIYAGHEEVCKGAADVVPVDLFIPGCPPHPLTILDGLLRLLGRTGER